MKKYNVIYIHTHDSGQIFSPYGYEVPTDGLKKFTEDATLFTNAFCTSPTCSPSRSALVTGQYPHHNGMMGLANRGFRLHDYGRHMVNIFRHNGYDTALCGIQHEYGRYSEHKAGAKQIGYQHDISSDCSAFSEKEMVQWDKNNVECFKRWLDTREEAGPFFLSFGFFSTHREYPEPSGGIGQADVKLPDFLSKYPEVYSDYRGHIESLKLFDENFTRLLQALKDKELYEETVILFTTDHGIAFPRAKCTLYDGGIRVALIVRVPGKQQGAVADGLVSHADILPTLCSLLELEQPGGFQGVDFSGVFSQPALRVRNEIFAEVNFHTSYEPIRCVRTERYKYIRYYDRDHLTPNLSNIDNSTSKQFYMENGLLGEQKEEEQFYDLYKDPQERINRIKCPEYEDEIVMLKERLAVIQEETGDPILLGPIPIEDSWIVNTNECIDPKSKNPNDFRSVTT